MDEELYDAILGDYGPVVTLILILTVSIIAILKLGVNFNLNDYIASRKRRHLSLARMYCPHMELIPREDNQIEIHSFLFSPTGTLDWVCSRCGAVMHICPSDAETQEQAQYYMAHPDAYNKQMRKFRKHARRSL